MGAPRRPVSYAPAEIFFSHAPHIAAFLLGAGSPPTIRLIYEHGKVYSREAEQVAQRSVSFSIGMAFVSVNTLLTGLFYSIPETWCRLSTGVVKTWPSKRRARPSVLQAAGSRGHHAFHLPGELLQLLRPNVLAQPADRGVDTKRVALVGAGRSSPSIPL